MVNSLLLATCIRILLVIVSYGAKVPAGIFVPSMAIGATFGRMVGIIVKAMYRFVALLCFAKEIPFEFLGDPKGIPYVWHLRRLPARHSMHNTRDLRISRRSCCSEVGCRQCLFSLSSFIHRASRAVVLCG